MLNEMFILQSLAFMTLIFFTQTANLITLWYLAGIYLVILGFYILLDDGDILVGFL
jgi:hypothetical protein